MHCTSPGNDLVVRNCQNGDCENNGIWAVEPTLKVLMCTRSGENGYNHKQVNEKSWFCCSNNDRDRKNNLETECMEAKRQSVVLITEPKPKNASPYGPSDSGPNLELLDLSNKLQHSERARESLQHQLNDAIDERKRFQHQLDALGSTYEMRTTEMRCVIMELSKKLRMQEDNAIIEENEPDECISELSLQEGSVIHSESELENVVDTEQPSSETQFDNLDISKNICSFSPISPQVQALQEEILYLRAQIALLQSQISSDKEAKQIYAEDKLHFEHFDSNKINNLEDSNKILHNIISEPILPKKSERFRLKRRDGEHIIKEKTNCDVPAKKLPELLCQSEWTQNILQTEIERLHQKVEHLKLQNTILSLTLTESKNHSNHLYLLCGKYESNAIALNQALNYSDRAIEAYDVMLALLESRLAVVEKHPVADESRRVAEVVARHLLQRLDTKNDTFENSQGPWHDPLLLNSKTENEMEPWTSKDDLCLRGHVSKLKGQRSCVQNTIVQLESPFFNDREGNICRTDIKRRNEEGGANKNAQFDIESAVIMQELLRVREDAADYKFQAEEAQKQSNVAEEKLVVLKDALSQLKAQLSDSEVYLAKLTQNRSSYSEAEHAVRIERELVEALSRESQLKSRIHDLSSSIQIAAKASEQKNIQVKTTVAELKQTNIALTETLEKCKKKYQQRLKKLEQKMLEHSPNQTQHFVIPETTL